MKKSKMSGIQKKYLKYMCTLLILALVLSSICVWTYVRRNMTDVIVDKYEFMNEWGMNMRRRSGYGPGITCLVRGTKLCLSEDM